MKEIFKKKKFIITLIISILFLTAAVIIIEKAFNSRMDLIENYINSYGPWAPLVLLILIIITSSIGFIFMIPVALTALLLNAYEAFFISVIGLTIGAVISFSAARYFARDYIRRVFIKKIDILNRYDEKIRKKGFLTVLFLRLISLIPYELINIASGLSQIDFSKFILATVIGIIPGSIITIYFIKSTQNIFSIQFLLATILFVGFSLLPLLSKKVRNIIFNLD